MRDSHEGKEKPACFFIFWNSKEEGRIAKRACSCKTIRKNGNGSQTEREKNDFLSKKEKQKGDQRAYAEGAARRADSNRGMLNVREETRQGRTPASGQKTLTYFFSAVPLADGGICPGKTKRKQAVVPFRAGCGRRVFWGCARKLSQKGKKRVSTCKRCRFGGILIEYEAYDMPQKREYGN